MRDAVFLPIFLQHIPFQVQCLPISGSVIVSKGATRWYGGDRHACRTYLRARNKTFMHHCMHARPSIVQLSRIVKTHVLCKPADAARDTCDRKRRIEKGSMRWEEEDSHPVAQRKPCLACGEGVPPSLCSQ